MLTIMKKYILLTLACSAFFIGQGHAQRSALKGPALKNHRGWKDPQPASLALAEQPQPLKGPAAKNRKGWKDKFSAPLALAQPGQPLKGPRAKNRKPWQEEPEVYPVVFLLREGARTGKKDH